MNALRAKRFYHEEHEGHEGRKRKMEFRDVAGFADGRIITDFPMLRFEANDSYLYRSSGRPATVESLIAARRERFEHELFFGGPVDVQMTHSGAGCVPRIYLQDVAALMEKYRRPRLFVSSLESPAFASLLEVMPAKFTELLEVKVSPLLTGPIGPRGLYRIDKDYYLFEFDEEDEFPPVSGLQTPD